MNTIPEESKEKPEGAAAPAEKNEESK